MTLTRWQRTAVLAAPLVVYVLFFVIPLISLGRMSLNEFTRLTGLQDAVTLDSFRTALTDDFYLRTFLTTLKLALIASVLCTALGCIVGYLMWRIGGNVRRVMLGVILAPLLVASVVRAFGWIGTIGPGGLLPHVSERIGLGTLTIYANEPAVIIGFVHILLPFAVILFITSLDNISPSVMKAAEGLGATEWRRIRAVVLPLTYPGVLSSLLFTFALASAAYSIPAILGGRRVLTASLAIYEQQTRLFNWPLAAALSLILIVVVAFAMSTYQALTRRGRTSRRRAWRRRDRPRDSAPDEGGVPGYDSRPALGDQGG
ncbi:MAG: ABC transporter permease subunit [Micromonosporaceae bacterium]|nr:ABC transporter permease subunit [Micromonosporaceae bacterium]